MHALSGIRVCPFGQGLAADGRKEEAGQLLQQTDAAEPWEHAVAACLRALTQHPGRPASADGAAELVRTYLALDEPGPPCSRRASASPWQNSTRRMTAGPVSSAKSRALRRSPVMPRAYGVLLRVVTRTAHEALPGSSGVTCAAPFASSRTMSTRRPVSHVRYSAARSSSPATPRSVLDCPASALVGAETLCHLGRCLVVRSPWPSRWRTFSMSTPLSISHEAWVWRTW